MLSFAKRFFPRRVWDEVIWDTLAELVEAVHSIPESETLETVQKYIYRRLYAAAMRSSRALKRQAQLLKKSIPDRTKRGDQILFEDILEVAWSDLEIEVLYKLKNSFTVQEIAKDLGMSVSKIYKVRQELEMRCIEKGILP